MPVCVTLIKCRLSFVPTKGVSVWICERERKGGESSELSLQRPGSVTNEQGDTGRVHRLQFLL